MTKKQIKTVPIDLFEAYVRYVASSREVATRLEMILKLKKTENEIVQEAIRYGKDVAMMKSRINSFNLIVPDMDAKLKDDINKLFRKHGVEGFKI